MPVGLLLWEVLGLGLPLAGRDRATWTAYPPTSSTPSTTSTSNGRRT
ncbi:MAG TPA: hypothetical protein VLJ59_00140 [Mycobacteriales bacterium]|nr:hypothetical protein [Mycobacteriales bacterium]